MAAGKRHSVLCTSCGVAATTVYDYPDKRCGTEALVPVGTACIRVSCTNEPGNESCAAGVHADERAGARFTAAPPVRKGTWGNTGRALPATRENYMAASIIIACMLAIIVSAFCLFIECYKTAVVLPVILVLIGIWFGQTEYGTVHHETFTVASLDDQGGSQHKYLVFTTDGHVYEDTDAWFHGKADSSDVWGRFLSAGTGATWDCPVYGYRNHFLSSYQDILDGCKLLRAGHAVTSAG
jgi:hypothetical protein